MSNFTGSQKVSLMHFLPGPIKRRIMGNLWIEYGMCLLLQRRRLKLPEVAVESLFPMFHDVPVQLTQLPQGGWSAPLADLVFLLKLIKLLRPKRVLEVGSFRGYTALAIAQHLDPDGRLIAVDIEPNHGEAYRGTPFEILIERRVGAISPEIFSADKPGSYDLIFIDADHRYEAVKNDTDTVMSLVAEEGLVVWHDYSNWGYYSGYCQVPEYLNQLSTKIPIAHIPGSNLAVHSPSWTRDKSGVYRAALSTAQANRDLWGGSSIRGG